MRTSLPLGRSVTVVPCAQMEAGLAQRQVSVIPRRASELKRRFITISLEGCRLWAYTLPVPSAGILRSFDSRSASVGFDPDPVASVKVRSGAARPHAQRRDAKPLGCDSTLFFSSERRIRNGETSAVKGVLKIL